MRQSSYHIAQDETKKFYKLILKFSDHECFNPIKLPIVVYKKYPIRQVIFQDDDLFR